LRQGFDQAAHAKIKKDYDNIFLDTSVKSIEPVTEGLKVTFEGKDAPEADVLIESWSLWAADQWPFD